VIKQDSTRKANTPGSAELRRIREIHLTNSRVESFGREKITGERKKENKERALTYGIIGGNKKRRGTQGGAGERRQTLEGGCVFGRKRKRDH